MHDTENSTPAEHYFLVPAPIGLHLLLYLFVTFTAGLAAWFIKGGMYAAAGVLAVVFIPLTALMFYVLVMVPGRARIVVDGEGVTALAAPFVQAHMPLSAIREAYVADMKTDPRLTPKDGAQRRGIAFGPYAAGGIELASGHKAVTLTRSNTVVVLTDGDLHLLLGPKNLDDLLTACTAKS